MHCAFQFLCSLSTIHKTLHFSATLHKSKSRMPPKKRAKESIQTKLSFKPISATKASGNSTSETAAPLRSHMSILNDNSTGNYNRPATSHQHGHYNTSSKATVSSITSLNGLSSFHRLTETQQTHEIGGKTSSQRFSATELSSSFTSSTRLSECKSSPPISYPSGQRPDPSDSMTEIDAVIGTTSGTQACFDNPDQTEIQALSFLESFVNYLRYTYCN